MKTTLLPTFLVSFLAAVGTAKVQPAARDSNEYQNYQAGVRALPQHKRGYYHLADDGVMRSLGPGNEVLGFVQASPAVLARVIADAPEADRAHLEAVWDGIDGRDVADPWTIKRELINSAHATPSGRTRRNEVLDASDIVVRDLSSPVWKRACSTAGGACSGNRECTSPVPTDNCICRFVDNALIGSCDEA
ncbi:hypothetical protein JX265_008810 [Neoarthrinium moseri]|uniref:Uncharacterized protein n=1 Tax=Neoarthrinium moseri TaxID=1658444 RepID=A0A9P9WHJ0_9PEZI|nr:uncharacterized protein JN550_009528 [Neoarthrinium moseri]KAI1848408.1 hypothetical protein JX266_005714 [Neoarthrinium moseri]KAI1863417.1 hypothetical protein JN550_009528 [Neoarthrinium moseri]KAI1863593.1 hypothetical protein JX265_008810 [Neoarthrinium moseri]